MKKVNSPSTSIMALPEQNSKTKLQIIKNAFSNSLYLLEEIQEKLRDTFPGWRIKRVLIRSYWTGYSTREFKWTVQKRVVPFYWRTYCITDTPLDAYQKLNYYYSVEQQQETTYFK